LAVRAELDGTVSAKARAQVAEYAAKRDPSITIAKAWSDFAMAAFLMGDSRLAAWAGLTAMRDDWQTLYVTNAGTYLVRLNRLDEALQLLNCAYAMGYRSPYLMEALAVAYQRLGDKVKANEAIQQARQLAPRDPIIEVEASLLGTGKPPARPDSGKPLDGMDRALRELEAHADRLSSKVKAFGEQLERLFPSQGGAPQATLTATYFTSLLDTVRKQAAEAKNLSRDQYMQRFQQPGTPFSADGYQQALNQQRNTALQMMIATYLQMTDKFLSFQADCATCGTPVFFWANALDLDARVLAAERPDDATLWSMHGLGPALAQRVDERVPSRVRRG
jgi:tetratricopeptide (TPR) repeat protein